MDEDDDGGALEQLQQLNASLDDDENGNFSPIIHPGRCGDKFSVLLASVI